MTAVAVLKPPQYLQLQRDPQLLRRLVGLLLLSLNPMPAQSHLPLQNLDPPLQNQAPHLQVGAAASQPLKVEVRRVEAAQQHLPSLSILLILRVGSV